jgi:hypothetical protein
MSAPRFMRVSRTLPVGVLLGSELGCDFDWSYRMLMRDAAAVLTLEVPVESAKEVAKALRALAEELET